MSVKPEPHREEFNQPEEEERRLHKKALMSKFDIVDAIVYLTNFMQGKSLLEDIYRNKRLDPYDLITTIYSIYLTQRSNTLSKYYSEDIAKNILKFLIPNSLKSANREKSYNLVKQPGVNYTRKNNHVLINTNEYQGDEPEIPQKIIIYRAKKNKVPLQQRNIKRK